MAVEEEEQKCPDCPACLPAYLATFADLMSLLMCFFVLLLSFAELDVKKFKQLAGSMRSAFGVQAQIKADSMPKGTSIIALEFSPGAPRQTITNEVRQETTDETKNDLDFSEGQDSGDRRSSEDDEKQKSEVPEIIDDAEAEKAKAQEEAEVEEELEEIQEQLKEEIAEDMLEVENDNGKIVIRIKEKGSFPSGRAELMPGFKEVMTKLQQVVKESGKDVIVAGHTDNRSIRTRRFRSNWDLSSARAVTVLNALLKEKGIESTKVMVQGRADTVPLYPNDTKEHRSKNRRVEIILVKGSDKEKVTTLEDLDKGHAEDAAEAQKADWDNDWEEGDDSETEIDEVDAVDPDSDTEFGAEDTGEEKTEEADAEKQEGAADTGEENQEGADTEKPEGADVEKADASVKEDDEDEDWGEDEEEEDEEDAQAEIVTPKPEDAQAEIATPKPEGAPEVTPAVKDENKDADEDEGWGDEEDVDEPPAVATDEAGAEKKPSANPPVVTEPVVTPPVIKATEKPVVEIPQPVLDDKWDDADWEEPKEEPKTEPVNPKPGDPGWDESWEQ